MFIPQHVIWPVPPVPTGCLRLADQRAGGETDAQNAYSRAFRPLCPAASLPFHLKRSGTQKEKSCFLPGHTVAF